MMAYFKYIWTKVLVALLVMLAVNFIAQQWYARWDLTRDKRFTLSQTTRETLLKIQQPVVIDVLLKGNIPTEFKKLQIETRQLLEEYSALKR